MYQILLVSFLVVAIALVAIILVQHGKGADMGASFGAGASNTVFGSSGSGNFLTRTTGVLATLFFAIALALGYMTAHQNDLSSNPDDLATQISNELGDNNSSTPTIETGIPEADIEDTPPESAIPEADTEDTPAPKTTTPKSDIEDISDTKKETKKDNGK